MNNPDYTPLASAPPWFAKALRVPFDSFTTQVGGVPINALTWGQSGKRGLVFVHGGNAQADWWAHIAPWFADEFRVVALDLSGHGDSGWREQYGLEQWTDEVLAVADAGGIDGPPVVVGHSMGGMVSIVAAARHAERIGGVIVIDSPVAEVDSEIQAHR
ncbi:MAG TPA: alpha/beta hydrolase, partial [Ilumatobacteraceae bacterium]|nr:alpha/beta hydrolase [Ilumatobacteraceae bacterium]